MSKRYKMVPDHPGFPDRTGFEHSVEVELIDGRIITVEAFVDNLMKFPKYVTSFQWFDIRILGLKVFSNNRILATYLKASNGELIPADRLIRVLSEASKWHWKGLSKQPSIKRRKNKV